MKIGKLTQVDLSTFWKDEASEFTPWLANHIDLLTEPLGIGDVDLIGTEERIGPFRADIVLEGPDGKIIIENQLDETDHKHLGQILTYAGGLNGTIMIWVAPHFKDEHRQAIDYLNRISGSEAYFFGVEIKMVRIGDQDEAAAIFDIVAKPNEWKGQTGLDADPAEATITQKAKIDYWKAHHEYMKNHGVKIHFQKPSMDHWSDFHFGVGGAHMAALVNSNKKTIGLKLQILNSKFRFQDILEFEDEAKAQISPDLEFVQREEGVRSHVSLYTNFDFQDETTRDAQFEWFKTYTERFIHFFKPILKELSDNRKAD